MRPSEVSILGKVLVVVACIAAIGLAVVFASRGDLARAEQASCRRVIADRLGAIEVRKVQAESARSIANDTFQSNKTRIVRRREADKLEDSIIDLRTRVDPAHGGKLICEEAFPEPRIF